MQCLNCDSELKLRQRFSAKLNSIVYHYYHCDKCDIDFDDEKYEIIHKEDNYIRKKDSNEMA